jgi:SNF2 family DNA or RNA helicase
VRTCALSEEQRRFYREVIETRAIPLREQLEKRDAPVPYLHVFAVLNLLKRICDHPALLHGQLDHYAEMASGKWDLFQEILEESLDSGQKVVVFSQYLGMIEILRRHLVSLGIGFAILTGATTNRGRIVERFNTDPGCRVFLGSLKAGGTGIDLVAGSVVVHYDRWWNAAREDQATDRVHRIGQKRAVQVFKLLTERTLEERIAQLIEKKRRLLGEAIAVDDPHLAKIFSREELRDLLAPL